MNAPDLIAAVIPVVKAFEQLNIDYHIGGSVASSVFGFPRSTIDADLVADIRLKHVDSLVNHLSTTYYIDGDSIRSAFRRKSSFSIIHLATMIKVDVFILKARAFDQEEFKRVQLKTLPEDDRLPRFASPEDVILNKLEWYKMGARFQIGSGMIYLVC